MTLACLALVVNVIFPGVPPLAPTIEHHAIRYCEINSIITEDLVPSFGLSRCELVANRAISRLQMDGILPGSKEIISYSATCDTEI